MTLTEHIEDIRNQLKEGLFINEAAVSQGIVLRLLNVLTWPTYNTQVITPEYSVEGRRIDFALCHPPSKPIVFIEVKQVGNIDGAERQLFEYAFHQGVPIAILTDGREWRFFHPTAQGDYRERKVCELNLSEGNSEENAKRLNRYLNYASIRAGEAVEAIKADYEEVVQQRQVATRLPEAWNKLVEEADEFLLHAVAEKTENLCDYRPSDEQVLDFLKSLRRETELALREEPSLPMPTPTFVNKRPNVLSKAPAKRLVVTMPNGEVIQHHNAMDTFREVIFKIGPEEVLKVDTERILISTEPIPKRRTTPYCGYHVTENHGTSAKQKLLERIAAHLGIGIKVEITDKL